MKYLTSICLLLLVQSSLCAQRPRARDIGIPFDGITGKYNAITDVKGVEVNKSYALPHKLVIDLLKKYNRIK